MPAWPTRRVPQALRARLIQIVLNQPNPCAVAGSVQGRAGPLVLEQLGKLIAQRVTRQFGPTRFVQRDWRTVRGLRLITAGYLHPQPLARVCHGGPPVMDGSQPFANPRQLTVPVQH